MKNVLKRCVKGVILLMLVSSGSLSAQVTNTESFDGVTFLPAGWSAVGATNYWSRKTTGTQPTCNPHSGAGMARFNSQRAAAGTAQTIATPVIDYSNLGNNIATFSLWVYRDTAKATIADSLSLFVNTTNTLTGAVELGVIARNNTIGLPNTTVAAGWYQYSFNIPVNFTTNTNYILLEGTSQAGNNIFIDDVQWTSFPMLCAGTPAAGKIIVANPLICGGTGATALTLAGDTAGYAGLSYVWESATSLSGPFTVIDTAVTSINTGTITGTTYYKYVVTCAYSSASDSTIDSVVVSNDPVPVITITPGNATYCTGNAPVALLATGANLLTWTPATGLNTDLGDSVLASPTSNTRYSVTGIDSLGCYGSATVNVTVRNSPAAGIVASRVSVCPGDSVLLIDTLTAFGAITYAWGPGAQTTDSITVMPASTTAYTVTTTLGGCSTIDTAVIAVNNVIAGFTHSATGYVATFTNTSLNATSFIWNFGNGDTSTQQSPSETYSSAGIDTVTLIAMGVCNNDTVTQAVTVFPAAISSLSAGAGVSVWPNPANNAATVQFTSTELNAQLMLMNDIGQVVQSRFVTPVNGQQFMEQVNLNGLPAGIYLVHIVAAQKDLSIQLIKM